MEVCPICEEGKLINKKSTRNVTYMGVSGKVNFYYSQCTTCESEVACHWQTSVNKDNMIYFHRLVDLKDTPWLSEAIKNP